MIAYIARSALDSTWFLHGSLYNICCSLSYLHFYPFLNDSLHDINTHTGQWTSDIQLSNMSIYNSEIFGNNYVDAK